MINYSVIVPHYNTPELLGRCLRSIPERDDIQVIVVDDNSPGNDDFLEQIPELSRKNVEFYVTKDGLGAGHARNIGLMHAKGLWLVFADSDDFFVDDFSTYLDKYVTDNHDIIYFNAKSCDCYNTSFIYEIDKLRLYRETLNELYIRVCYSEPWGKFIKRSLVEEYDIHFQETKSHNDLLFSVKTGLKAKSVFIIDKPIYWYVIREGSIANPSGRESLEKLCDRVRAWHETQIYLNENGIETTMYLPVFICIRALKQSVCDYFKIILYMRKMNMYYFRALIGTIRYLLISIINKDALIYYNTLSKRTINNWRDSVKTNI